MCRYGRVTSARDVVGMCLDLLVFGVDDVRMELAESALWGDSVIASDPCPSDPGLGAPICEDMRWHRELSVA